MKILCVTGKEGRVQDVRMKLLKKHLPFKYDVMLISRKNLDPNKYDLVYYSQYSLLSYVPFKGKKICSITSHKCLDEKKKTRKILKKFNGISVNNTLLLSEFRKKFPDVFYTPNGVDTDFFSYIDKFRGKKLRVGWVGNGDRDTKNFKRIVKPLSKMPDFKFNFIVTSKKQKSSDLKSSSQMRDYYHGLDLFLVCSSTEGTPNPALEAMSCGVPVISTKVGNMIEIINHGKNGFLIPTSLDSFRNQMEAIKDIDTRSLRQKVRKSMLSWDWSVKSENWKDFFQRYANE